MIDKPALEALPDRHNLRTFFEDGPAHPHQDLDSLIFITLVDFTQLEHARIDEVLDRVPQGLKRTTLFDGTAAADGGTATQGLGADKLLKAGLGFECGGGQNSGHNG